MSNILHEIRMMAINAKMDRVSRGMATAAGVPDDDKSFAEWMDTHGAGKAFAKVQEGLPTDQAGRLVAYRKAIGEEMWADVKNNPSLNDMVKQWFADVVMGRIQVLKTDLTEFFKGTEITAEDVELLVAVSFGQ